LKKGFVNQYQMQQTIDGTLLEVLPVSNRIWSIGTQWVTKYQDEISQQETAQTPEASRVLPYALPAYSNIRLAPEMQTGMRTLTSAEAAEIGRYARNLWLKPLIPMLLLTVWFWGLVIFVMIERHPPTEILGFLHLGFLTLMMEAYFVWAVRQAVRLCRDLTSGEVRQQPGPPGMQDKVVEVLPNAQQVWTMDGVPADWRRPTQWNR
jgi:hypothetical protein